MKNIALIGCGQLGSRHLQALASVNRKLKIQVIDPSGDSLKIAESRFKEVSQNFSGNISYHTDITSLEKKLDVVIIATNSKIRRNIIEQLVAQSTVDYLILEKILFTKVEDYMIVEKILKENNIKAWVNCARRMMEFYQSLRKQIKGHIHFTVTGNAWGLGCNGIHLLDLFAYLIKSQNITLSNNLIDKTIVESKRPGYIEFTGTVTGYSDHHSFHMTSFPSNDSPMHITINTPTARYIIQEGNRGTMRVSKHENKWLWEEQSFTMPFQSQLSNKLVEDILETGNCDLTTYKESSMLHLLFLNNFISLLKEINPNKKIEECLIT